MIMKSRRRTSFLSCAPRQPLFISETIARGITYYKRPLLLTLPFIGIWKPLKRGHLLRMLSLTIVDSLLVRYRWAVPAVAVALAHFAKQC